MAAATEQAPSSLTHATRRAPKTPAPAAARLGQVAPTGPFLDTLRAVVGRPHVLTEPRDTERFRLGYRSGGGAAEAVARPGTLLEFWRTLRRCVEAGRIVIVQAANTGLTEGSTPSGEYGRPVVVVSTLRLGRIHPILGGRQVVCHAGATLYELERVLDPLGRDPHSVIGSSCRRLGGGGRVQQLRWRASAAGARLHRARALRPPRRRGHA